MHIKRDSSIFYLGPHPPSRLIIPYLWTNFDKICYKWSCIRWELTNIVKNADFSFLHLPTPPPPKKIGIYSYLWTNFDI